MDMMFTLYENEVAYTKDIYAEAGNINSDLKPEEVTKFLRYNANKALQNLGFEDIFSEGREDVNPLVMNGINTNTSNHDFFSAVGNGYILGTVEAMQESDYDMI